MNTTTRYIDDAAAPMGSRWKSSWLTAVAVSVPAGFVAPPQVTLGRKVHQVASHGVLGVVASGLIAAKQILKVAGVENLLTERSGPLTIYPSQRPEEWTDKLTKRRNRRAKSSPVAEEAAAQL